MNLNLYITPHEELICNTPLQYMQINADFMNGLSIQLDTSDVVSRIHNFFGK